MLKRIIAQHINRVPNIASAFSDRSTGHDQRLLCSKKFPLFFVCLNIFFNGFLIVLSVEKAFASDKTKEQREKPIEIFSKTAEFQDQKRSVTYKGSVIMNQGNYHLSSDILVIVRDTKGKIESMIATGNPATLSISQNQEPLKRQGHANIIEFYPKEEKILLLQNAELNQNNETIRAEKLTYFLSTRVLVSHPVLGKKTRILLAPKSPAPNFSNVLPTGNPTP